MQKTLGMICEAIFEDILLVEVVDDFEIVGCEIFKVDEGPLELSNHLVIEINFRLRDIRHFPLPPVLTELNHQLALLHFCLLIQLVLIVLPDAPHALPYVTPRHLPQVDVLLEVFEYVQRLRLA